MVDQKTETFLDPNDCKNQLNKTGPIISPRLIRNSTLVVCSQLQSRCTRRHRIELSLTSRRRKIHHTTQIVFFSPSTSLEKSRVLMSFAVVTGGLTLDPTL